MATLKVVSGPSTGYKRLRTDFEESKKQDMVKNNIIENLLEDNIELRKQLNEKQLYVKEDWEQLLDLQKKMWARAYVSVLIDGDSMPFNDVLVQQGNEGGREAAHLLKREVERFVQDDTPDGFSSFKIKIHVFANMKGLSIAYLKAGIFLKQPFNSFVEGFNAEDSSIYFTDVGCAKECADYKLKENFEFYIGDPSCQHVFFGGSADNGYARTLGPYTRDMDTAKRVTLIEGPPFAREVAEMVGNKKFRKTSFENVFRNSKLPSGTTSQDSPPKRYVDIVVSGMGSTADHSMWRGALKRPLPPKSPWDENGRVDLPVTRPPQADLDEAIARKPCERHHLFTRCKYGDGCAYSHEELNEKQFIALRYVARQKLCRNSRQCHDVRCPYDHS